MKLSEIHLRDPFILPEDGKYYLYGTRGATSCGPAEGLDVFVSEDLENWSEAHEVFTAGPDFWSHWDFWAPEVHKYNGKYYMFASFKADKVCRGTQILVADSPMGPFNPLTDRPVTPSSWECLDGTLYVSPNGTPYIVFCHEWSQVKDGEVCALQLTPDLKEPVGEPRLLFHASEPEWSYFDGENYVTDGPFLYRMQDGKLLLLWSSFSKNGYTEAIAVSDNGDITGNFTHAPELLFESNGGHGMVFRDFNGELRFVMHGPNVPKMERPMLYTLVEADGTLKVK